MLLSLYATASCVPQGVSARYPDGYPVFLSSELPQARLNDLVTYLLEAPYLDANATDRLSAEMVIYNAQRSVFSRISLLFRFTTAGAVSTTAEISAWPAVEYGGRVTESTWRVFLPDFFLVVISTGYLILTSVDHYAHWREARRLKEAEAHFRELKVRAAGVTLAASCGLKSSRGTWS